MAGLWSVGEKQFIAPVFRWPAWCTTQPHGGRFPALHSEPDFVLLPELGDACPRLLALVICCFLHEKLYLVNSHRVVRVDG